jgi:hypothetical protein
MVSFVGFRPHRGVLRHAIRTRLSPGQSLRSASVKRKAEAPAGKRPWQLDRHGGGFISAVSQGRGWAGIEAEETAPDNRNRRNRSEGRQTISHGDPAWR